jgi:hypothetical protein
MLVASTSVAMVASDHPTEKNSARNLSRQVHCRHRQISSRRASVAIPSYRVASKATQRGDAP